MSATIISTGIGRLSNKPTIAIPGVERLLRPFHGLYRRQPQLTTAAAISLVAILPCLMALLLDTRTVNGISVWIKPTKFFISFAG